MHPTRPIPVEICINCADLPSTVAGVSAAKQGGASRVELCSRMDVGGMTPDPALVAAARTAWGDGPGILAMVRPRAGDFAYSAPEITRMGEQIRQMAQAGADGVVLGAVQHGRLDRGGLAVLFRIAKGRGMSTTCHRAFDAVDDQPAALIHLADLGVDRVLTSGTPWDSGLTVADGIGQVGSLLAHCPPELEIVLGGGVDGATIGPILDRLPEWGGRISVHAYSSVLRQGVAHAPAVADLVAAANRVSRKPGA